MSYGLLLFMKLMYGVIIVLSIGPAVGVCSAVERAEQFKQSASQQKIFLRSVCVNRSSEQTSTDFEQNAVLHTHIHTDTGHQTRPKPVTDNHVDDELLAWDELLAHDNAQLPDLATNLGTKSATSPIKTGAISYENNSNLSS